MDNMDYTLSKMAANPKYKKSICVAVELARRTLNRYYSKTDLSKAYRIAMGTYIGLSL